MTQRRLWLLFTIAFAMSLIGATILFIPRLEFAAVDLIEKLHLSIGIVGNIAIYGELTLFILSSLGLIALTIRRLIGTREPNP